MLRFTSVLDHDQGASHIQPNARSSTRHDAYNAFDLEEDRGSQLIRRSHIVTGGLTCTKERKFNGDLELGLEVYGSQCNLATFLHGLVEGSQA